MRLRALQAQYIQGLRVNAAGTCLRAFRTTMDYRLEKTFGTHAHTAHHAHDISLKHNGRGPICTLFSKMGRQRGVRDPKFLTHSSYYQSMKRISDIMIIENVPEYRPSIAEEHLGDEWTTESLVVDPRVLGTPASRARLYILAFRKATVKRRKDVWFGCVELEVFCK